MSPPRPGAESRSAYSAGGPAIRILRLLLAGCVLVLPAPVTAQVIDEADLLVFTTVDNTAAETINLSDPVTFSVYVANASTTTVANGVVVTTELPDCVIAADRRSRGCLNDPLGVPECELGDIAPDEFKDVSIDIKLPGCIGRDSLGLVAKVGALTVDPDLSTNTTTEVVLVNPLEPPEADLRLTLVTPDTPVNAGEPIIYRAKAFNLGPLPANDVRLRVEFPGELRFAVVTVASPATRTLTVNLPCVAHDGAAECPLSDILVDDTADVAIALNTTVQGEFPTTVSIRSARQVDADETNNVVSASATVLRAIAGDFDGDRCVTTADVALFAATFRARRYDQRMDFNSDGVLNTLDIAGMRAAFGNGDGEGCQR